MGKTAKLVIDNKEFEFPIIEGTEGEKAIDIAKLRSSTGYITYDNGLGNTGACLSDITYIDGDLGILKHRGFELQDLCDNLTYIEVAYLLFNNHLPSHSELTQFTNEIKSYYALPTEIVNLIKSFSVDTHPMCIISAAMVALSGVHKKFLDPELTAEQKKKVYPLLLGQFSTICAYAYRHGQRLPFIPPRADLDYIQSFLYLMKGEVPHDDVVKALDVLLILHADHEQNCSTSTVRVAGSSQANIFASLSSGINALWGPLHGGANQAVLEMLDAIHKDGGGYKKFIDKAKDKDDNFKLMGFGHRVYKNFDPRARIIKKYCDTLLVKLNVKDPLLDIAKGLEEVALKDEYFAQRKLYPNVDFYSGIIYKALGIPTNLFTVMFALGRQPGWISQWKEMTEDPAAKIVRPRQIFTGKTSEKVKK